MWLQVQLIAVGHLATLKKGRSFNILPDLEIDFHHIREETSNMLPLQDLKVIILSLILVIISLFYLYNNIIRILSIQIVTQEGEKYNLT